PRRPDGTLDERPMDRDAAPGDRGRARSEPDVADDLLHAEHRRCRDPDPYLRPGHRGRLRADERVRLAADLPCRPRRGDPGVSAQVVPVVELCRSSASPALRQAVASRIDAAYVESGFLMVVGHGVDAALRQEMVDVTNAFFAQPRELKA